MHYKDLHGIFTLYMFNHVIHDLNEGTQGHSLKLFKGRSKREGRAHFFSQSVVNLWNLVPDTVVTAPSLNTLPNRFDKYWLNQTVRYDYKAKLMQAKSDRYIGRSA